MNEYQKQKRKWPWIWLPACVLLFSCGATKDFNPGHVKSLNKVWEELNLLSRFHTGLAIFDLKKEKWIFRYRDDNFFTPGSNIKILTMFTALQYLDEKIPAAYYQIKGDSIFVWGGGDPGTFYPDIKGQSALVDFLIETEKTIVFSDHHFMTKRFGTGWAWDDYPFNYQIERTAFPIYGNRLWIERYTDSIVVTPSYFKLVLSIKKDTIDKFVRNEDGTSYFYHYSPLKSEDHARIPLSLFENDIRFIWKSAIGKDILFKDLPMPRNTMRLDGAYRDSLLQYMMHESDNFIAEQLLLSCALRQTGKMSESLMINKVLEGPLKNIPDKIQWVDGSGLSRYNLLTPRSTIFILEKMIKMGGLDYIKSIFPAGGASGNIKDLYKSDNGQPYIYAKTGSLRNTHCISGIIITKSGRVLLFSWMNNQFIEDPEVVKVSMEKLFVWLRDNY